METILENGNCISGYERKEVILPLAKLAKTAKPNRQRTTVDCIMNCSIQNEKGCSVFVLYSQHAI